MALFLTGCAHDPPTAGGLQGRWTSRDGGALVFEERGDVRASHFKRAALYGESDHGYLDQAQGTWTVSRRERNDTDVQIDFLPGPGLPDGFSFGFSWDGKRLYTYIGDPDSGNRYVFQRS